MSNAAIYERITEKVITALEAGVPPWRRGWKQGNEAAYGFPHNAENGRPYRGINVWILMAEAEEKCYQSTGWITPLKAKKFELNFKGEKTTEVVFWNRSTRTNEEGVEKTWMYMKSFRVLNLDQCEGDKSKLKGHMTLALPEELEEGDGLCEAISKAMPIKIKHGGDRAYYSPPKDFIGMPPHKAFDSDEDYWSTLMHETVHSTGHKDRCNREFGTRFGSESYAAEELVAELGCVYLSAMLGHEIDVPNHASYLESWLKVLKADPKALFTTASAAQKACDYILDKLELAEAPEYTKQQAA